MAVMAGCLLLGSPFLLLLAIAAPVEYLERRREAVRRRERAMVLDSWGWRDGSQS